MKKALKIAVIIISIFFLILVSFVLYAFTVTASVKLDDKKLINMEKTITYFDVNNNVITEKFENNLVTDFNDIPSHVKEAFVAIEDKRFYSHNGIDKKGLFRAFFNNLKTFSFREGGSTISQQLIKNTHLSNEKTLKRKLIELKLSKKLEDKYTKNQILEMYLNTIYFGNNCYGITSASLTYFNKKPSELSLNESAVLAGLINAPSIYSPLSDLDKCFKRKNIVLGEMFKQGYISKTDFNNAKVEQITLNDNYENKNNSYLKLVKKEMDDFMENHPKYNKKYKIYTSFDPKMQEILDKSFEDVNLDLDKSALLINNDFSISAYYSTCGNVSRQMGSTAKPLLVYAPAIELDLIYPCTRIKDEEVSINGFNVQNYKNKYYGDVSVQDSLSKSLNSCSVKILNGTGIEKSLNFVKKTDIPLTEKDNNLSVALGNTEKGAKLTELTSAYNVFASGGVYKTPKCIVKITDENGNVLYKNEEKNREIYSKNTVSLMNLMLKNVVECGTAKKLSYTGLDLYAKTGTVGNENGNTDAYTISYSKDYSLGVWLGNDDSSYMSNKITGGSYPADISAYVWRELYKNKNCEPINDEGIVKVSLDKISLYDKNEIELADTITPKRYCIEEYFKETNIPKTTSNRFSSPKIDNCELVVKNKGIEIQLCVIEYLDYKIFKSCNEKKELIYDSKLYGKKDSFLDDNLLEGNSYVYSIMPYFTNEDKEFFGEEIFLKEIKMPRKNLGKNDDWWISDF